MRDITDILTADEMARVTDKSDLRATLMVACQYAIVAGIFIVVAIWTNPLTILLGTIMLGGRFLGFGVLSHECGHRACSGRVRLNAFVAEWLLAPASFANNRAYMRGHWQHHRQAGTENDPDLPNYRDYPITRARLRRKIKRDITGQTGWRSVKGIALRLWHIRALDAENRACILRGLAFNLLLLGILIAAGHPWLYLMWVAAFVFVNPLVSRLRQVAEHGAVPDLYDADPRQNTRTTYVGPLTRLLFIPHRVNYHLEHHMLASVPAYRLKTLHEILKANGYYDGVDFPRGYLDMLRRATMSTPVATPTSSWEWRASPALNSRRTRSKTNRHRWRT
ncbi:MAG: fatty acid desaturase family protein [Gammaproteobacteria bacterium]|nr:fatty acid desaturase family protein [Gammaproteobacteria bacterium]